MLNTMWLYLIIILIILGLHFTKKINFKNYKVFSLTKKLNYETLFLALGTKMGVGSLIGTTMSIFIGGPGSLFWIYLFTLITSSLIYIESFLGSKYKQKTKSGYIGGIYYYTKFGLKNNVLAIIMLIMFITTYSIFFLMIQTNTIKNTLLINPHLLTIIILILSILLITNNINEIKNTLNKIVPFICIFFISISLYKIIKNINLVGIIFNTIIKSAFNTKSMLVGIVIGIKRSIFLNELLIGTTSMSSGINNMDKKVTANTLVIGSYFIVFIVSTLLTMLILIYKINTNVVDTSYINLLKNTFTYHYNTLGNYYLNLMITLLATSSIISGIYIGLSNINYLTNNKVIINITKLIILTTLTLGIYLNTDKIWLFIDIMMLSLITLNSIIIYKLRDKII